MGAGEHALELGRLDAFLQAAVHLRDLGKGRLVLGFLPQLDHHPHVVQLPDERVPALDDLFQGGAPAEDLLGSVHRIPETGRCDLGLDLLERFPFGVYVKETPEVWRYVLQNPACWLLLHETCCSLIVLMIDA